MHYTTLIAAVADINGASFVGIDTRTEVKLLGGQKNPCQGRVTKRTLGATVMAFTNQNIDAYKAMVERRLVKEGKAPTDFVLGARSWGTRIPNMPIVEHKGAYYLEVIFLSPGKSYYELDGTRVQSESIPGLPVTSHGKQGGLDNKVIIRDFRSDSITEIRINGKVIK